ncbi:ROK family protein [Fischerella sp. NIES-3754]|uniref:ROK family protein n=1 Tax=Fischerella sp. NIES-3754 TaxID=1752063 RepID=UPI00071F3FE1|nr:ROK family protein [Fischerella sp. NIES-3754]BAU07409.1 glucokinase [Fischerella sp. NIES-3754]BCX09737.1 MAG: hypothetical protein KatS3mg066_3596 [Fischerella sp.]
MSIILALDFGDTKLAAAIAHAGSQEWLGYERRLSPVNADVSTDLEIMRSLIHSLLQGEKPTAIGVSFGGPVDANTGTVRLSHHVPGWENIPLRQLLAEEYGVAVGVDNDANVAALGVGIGNVANLMNPQRFVLGGSVTKAGEGYWQVIRQVAQQTALPEINFEVVPAGLGDDALLWGAVALALDTVEASQGR